MTITPHLQLGYTIEVRRFDLLGNEKDGFDNNDIFTIGGLKINEEPTDKQLKRIARDYFTGLHYALSEKRDSYMSRYQIDIEWQDGDLEEKGGKCYYDVRYRGTFVGELVITRE